MSIPTGVSRWVLQGHLANGEIFETGWWEEFAPDTETAANSAAEAQWGTFKSSCETALVATLPATAGYDGLKVYSYPVGGPGASVIGNSTSSGFAGSASTSNADQLAMVITTLTGQAGRSKRGRMYLPATGVAPANGFMTAATCTAVVNAVANFFRVLVAGSTDPVVVSQKGAGSAQHIVAVRVDQRYDIQRRRANREDTGTTTLVTL